MRHSKWQLDTALNPADRTESPLCTRREVTPAATAFARLTAEAEEVPPEGMASDSGGGAEAAVS